MLTLTLKTPPRLPLDAAGWLPEACPTARQAAEFALLVGSKRVRAGELFDISGDGQAASWRFEGDLANVHHLGEGMTTGEMACAGGVGRHCGERMQGGRITIQGDAGDWLGATLRGGAILVHGNAGNHVGGCRPGEKFGMRDGELVVLGDAGDHAGESMRRGLLVVGGRCGRLAGYRMRAGTLMVLGECGDSPGVEMLRGTLALLAQDCPALPPTYRAACLLAPTALALLRGRVARIAGRALADAIPGQVQFYNGDVLRGGRGEVLTR